jgi:cell division protein FtsB
LQRFANSAKTSPQRGPAERAVTDLRAGRKPADDLKSLRQEMIDLEQANRDLKHQVESLEKKLAEIPASETRGGKSKPKRRSAAP